MPRTYQIVQTLIQTTAPRPMWEIRDDQIFDETGQVMRTLRVTPAGAVMDEHGGPIAIPTHQVEIQSDGLLVEFRDGTTAIRKTYRFDGVPDAAALDAMLQAECKALLPTGPKATLPAPGLPVVVP